MPANTQHEVRCESRRCTIAVIGDGPFDIKYADPQDDPRNAPRG